MILPNLDQIMIFFSKEYLANHLEKIIVVENITYISTKPPVQISRCKKLPQLASQAPYVKNINAAHL